MYKYRQSKGSMGYSCPLTSEAASQVSHMTLCILWEGGWHWDGRQWGQRLTDQHHEHSGVSRSAMAP